jgi:glycosyl transferase, family 25
MTDKSQLFKEINRFFDRVYVISLKKSSDRHELLSNTLEGLDYEIFWGVNGMELKSDNLNEEGKLSVNGSGNNSLTSGEIGCALSHLAIYKKIVDQNLENALILEDDLVLKSKKSEGLNILNSGLKELPDDWEFLYLGYALNNNKMSYSAYLRAFLFYPILCLFDRDRFNPFKYRRRFPRKYSQNLQKSGYHYRLHSYGVSRAGAQKIIDYQTPVKLAADNAVSEMCTENKLNAFRLKKRIFFQNRDLNTTIKGRYNKSQSPHKN